MTSNGPAVPGLARPMPENSTLTDSSFLLLDPMVAASSRHSLHHLCRFVLLHPLQQMEAQHQGRHVMQRSGWANHHQGGAWGWRGSLQLG